MYSLNYLNTAISGGNHILKYKRFKATFNGSSRAQSYAKYKKCSKYIAAKKIWTIHGIFSILQRFHTSKLSDLFLKFMLQKCTQWKNVWTFISYLAAESDCEVINEFFKVFLENNLFKLLKKYLIRFDDLNEKSSLIMLRLTHCVRHLNEFEIFVYFKIKGIQFEEICNMNFSSTY